MGNQQQRQTNTRPKKVSKTQVEVACLRVKAHLQLVKQRKSQEVIKSQKSLVALMNTQHRNKIEEVLLMEKIVNDLKYIQACTILIAYAASLRNYAGMIAESEGNVNHVKDLAVYVYSIIYASRFLGLFTLNEFRQLMMNFFGTDAVPLLADAVDPKILEYFKVKPSHYELNMYILEMGNRNKLALDKINQIHQFTNNPIPQPQVIPEQPAFMPNPLGNGTNGGNQHTHPTQQTQPIQPNQPPTNVQQNRQTVPYESQVKPESFPQPNFHQPPGVDLHNTKNTIPNLNINLPSRSIAPPTAPEFSNPPPAPSYPELKMDFPQLPNFAPMFGNTLKPTQAIINNSLISNDPLKSNFNPNAPMRVIPSNLPKDSFCNPTNVQPSQSPQIPQVPQGPQGPQVPQMTSNCQPPQGQNIHYGFSNTPQAPKGNPFPEVVPSHNQGPKSNQDNQFDRICEEIRKGL